MKLQGTVLTCRAGPEITYVYRDNSDKAEPVAQWQRSVSIDLRWVATAAPYWPPLEASMITLCGTGINHGFGIEVSYEEFMPMWLKAKGIEC